MNIKALKEIKEMCSDSDCEECPFDAGMSCILQQPPCEWELELIEQPVQQQAFANQGKFKKNGEEV